MKNTTNILIFRLAKHYRSHNDFFTQAWANRCFERADKMPAFISGQFLFWCGVYGEVSNND